MMTAKEAIEYIEDYTWSTSRLGLERTQELLRGIGDPQKKLRFIHVTGSNGKGSTCAILDSCLRAAGYRTGLYTSPYICEFNERMQVNGVPISGEDLARITETVREYADSMEDHPSQFELVTAIAMEYFLESECDIVVLEVGMGGALDSTNVIDAPEVAVFTNIGLEHTEYLGKTIEAIARTKGGIIKPGCDVVCYDTAPEAIGVLRQISSEKCVDMQVADFGRLSEISHGLDGQKVIWQSIEGNPLSLNYPLLGKHQQHNLSVALTVIEIMKKRGYAISDNAVVEGVAHVKWPARFEILSQEPLFILDGGHNPQCADAMATILSDYLPGRKVTFLMGVLADKDYNAMLDSVSPHAARFVCVTPDSPRALKADALAQVITDRGYSAEAMPNVRAGIEKALSYSEPIVAFGSLYMSGAVLREFRH